MVRVKLKCDICGKEYKAYGCYRSKERHLCQACKERRRAFINRLKINIHYEGDKNRDDRYIYSREADW